MGWRESRMVGVRGLVPSEAVRKGLLQVDCGRWCRLGNADRLWTAPVGVVTVWLT